MLIVITRKVDFMFELCKYNVQDLKLHWKGIGKRIQRPSVSTQSTSRSTVVSRGIQTSTSSWYPVSINRTAERGTTVDGAKRNSAT
jgi:hypothetical protein